MLSFKKIFWAIFLAGICENLHAQSDWSLSSSVQYGAILPHSPKIYPLVEGFSRGLLLSTENFNAHSEHTQESIGFSLHSQWNASDALGDLYGAYAFYSYYFWKKRALFRVAQGLSYATNPYNSTTNPSNVAYGSHFMPSSYFQLGYVQPNIYENFGLEAQLFFVHHSNGATKMPNTGTNLLAATIGVNYRFEASPNLWENPNQSTHSLQKIRLLTHLRTGMNQSYVLGIPSQPFVNLSTAVQYANNSKNAWSTGVDAFFSYSIKKTMAYEQVAYPEKKRSTNAHWGRAGFFVGYERPISQVALEAQVGYYIFDKYKDYGKFYQRVGLKYPFSSKWFASMGLKTHLAKAEALEFGLGVYW